MEKTFIIALHGFLGRPSDWDAVISNFKSQENFHNNAHISSKKIEWITPDLFNDSDWGAGYDLDKTHHCIYQQAKNLSEHGLVYIVGYSMGGRLALGALAIDAEQAMDGTETVDRVLAVDGALAFDRDAKVFQGAILISVNPGLKNEAEKTQRLVADKIWSDKIEKIKSEEDFNLFIQEWNSQPVFANECNEPTRNLNDYDFEKLANAMQFWSLGLQNDYRKILKNSQTPIMWINGEGDSKFLKITESISETFKANNKLEHIKVKNAAHRILFAQPAEISKVIRNLINKSKLYI